MTKIPLNADDLIAQITAQRNAALDEAAKNAAAVQALLRQVEELEARLKRLEPQAAG